MHATQKSRYGWTSHSIEPMGCGGPSFSLHVHTVTPPDLSATDVMETFSTKLRHCQPLGLNVTGRRDDLQEIDSDCWDRICEGLTIPSVNSLGFTTAFCRKGYEDKRVIALLKKRDGLPNITSFTIHDGLYGYSDTFLQMFRLPNLQTLVLRDSSYGVPLGRDVCESLALGILSLQKLKHINLESLSFACLDDWKVVLTALTSHPSLETVQFFRLQMGGSRVDISSEAQNHPIFEEKRKVFAYLQKVYPSASTYSVSQMLDAYLFVRASTNIRSARPSHAMSVISDKPDLLFELIRCQIDPSVLDGRE